MKINIVGGGPAGLYFAILMKKSNPANEIIVYERNGPDDTFGWGVVFSGRTLETLRQADAESHADITNQFEAWDNVDVVRGDEKISVRGNSFTGISRLRLLKILQQRAEQLGVAVLFHSEITDIESVRADCHLMVGADGINSTVRQRFEDRFEPNLSVRSNKYIWYGTSQLFHGLTLTFRVSDAGIFSAHSYKFNQTASTFIVECDQLTWQQGGFEKMNDVETRSYLEQVFKSDLQAHPLLSNNSKWINFVLVKNGQWAFENTVLIGDALHTAHFSIGSGTKLAMEDAITLAGSFQRHDDVIGALSEFESSRKPYIEEYQAAALESMLWFENVRQYIHLSPIELAYSLMMRSGRVNHSDLKKRDPQFVSRYEAAAS